MDNLTALVVLILFVFGLIKFIKYTDTNSSNVSPAMQRLQTASGVAADGFIHFEQSTGIAANPEDRTITLMINEKCKKYQYTDIRTWEYKDVKATKHFVPGGNFQQGVAVLGANLRERKVAAAETGFYLEVRDIDDPHWRIVMSNPTMQKRWMEILRQELNEGGVKRVEQAAG